MHHNLFSRVLSTLIVLLIISCSPEEKGIIPENHSITEYLSGKKFTPKEAILLKDNDLAFASKIDIIRNAKHQLKFNYYIFSPDESTSFLVNEILKKVSANKDFKVKILTDYQYNYHNLDFFKWLENQQPNGVKQIEVGLYNRPTINIMKLAEFMTLEADNAMSVSAKIFLAGLYAQKPNVLLYGLQGGYKRSVESIKLAEEAKDSKSKIAQIKQLGTLYIDSKKSEGVKKIGAKLALGSNLAGLFLGKQIGPLLNSAKTVLPFSIEGVDNLPLMKHPDLEYITDYTHHKFILGDEATVQVGGRNVANAYHIHPTHLEKYYTFMDTDVFMALDEQGGALFNSAFDRLWNFKSMVASLEDVAKHAPPSYLHLIDEMDKIKTGSCDGETDAAKKEACLAQFFSKLINEGEAIVPFTAEKQVYWDKKFKSLLATYEKYLATKKPYKSWTAIDQIFNSAAGYVQQDNIKIMEKAYIRYGWMPCKMRANKAMKRANRQKSLFIKGISLLQWEWRMK